jgi:tRNA nucleotidyltransferase/poly(A) polymerase
MPDYIYLLENRLSADQQNALRQLREAAREAGTILFLIGDAVRDLTSGHAVRDLEVAMHGNALKLKKTIEKLGGNVWGEDEPSRTLYLCFPGTVRVDLVSTHRVEYPKPGKPIYHPASIQEDLRRRDFTVNAMAISLNEGSFGLLMDPMNGAADIESRALRLVSNYGFLEEPSLLIRATRYMARLGWEMDPRTRARRDNAREEGVIEHLSAQARSRELEQIGHEEDGLKVLSALEADGWMKVLFSPWTPAKADEEKLTALHDLAVELLLQGVHADMSAAQMRLLTAKLAPKDLAGLKKLMLRPGFVEEWNNLDSMAAGFAKVLLAKENSAPSAGFKLFTSYDPEAVLWLGFTSKDAAIKERFDLFLKVWPEVRQRLPHSLLQEMRITPELPAYHEIVRAVFLELLDGRLGTQEEARAFLEPHSPPAPPPQVTVKRPRVKRGSEAKLKEHAFDDDEAEDHLEDDEDLDDIGGDDDELDLGLHLPKVELDVDLTGDSEIGVEDEDDEEDDLSPEPVPILASAKRELKQPAQPKPDKPAPLPAAEVLTEAEKRDAAPAAPRQEEAERAARTPEPMVEPQPEPKLILAPQEKPVIAVATPATSPIFQPAPAKAAARPERAEGQEPGPKSRVQPKAESKPAVPKAKPDLKAARPSASPADTRLRPTQAKATRAQGKEPSPQARPAAKKAPAKTPAKPPVKAADKLPAKAAPKAQVKTTARARGTTPASKLSDAKKNAVSARSPRPAKTTKPSKAVIRRPLLKPAKKR